jgi:hypothetical protein
MPHLDLTTTAALGLAAVVLLACAQPPGPSGPEPEALNMRLVGYGDLQARSAYQPTIQKQGQRWIAYVGHHGDQKLDSLSGRVEHSGWVLVHRMRRSDCVEVHCLVQANFPGLVCVSGGPCAKLPLSGERGQMQRPLMS